MNLAKRSVTSSAYNITANIISMGVGFVSSIILARLIEPEVFGVVAFAASIVQITTGLPNFGFGGAFLRRTGGEAGVTEEILRVYFALKLLFSLVWAALMVAGGTLFLPAQNRWVFWIVLATAFVAQQTTVIDVLLTRRVQFRRLAIAQVAITIARNLISILLAWRGWGIWALLADRIVAVAVEVIVLYVIRPVWRPRLGWSKELVQHFIGFGSKVFWGTILMRALDQVDDVWTGAALGDRALGFYHKAYGFATYPRQILANPLTRVVGGTYAQLADDRKRLSQAFSWVNVLLARANFWVAAMVWLVAPEFIRLAIGVKWLPMLEAFRLMLVYTLFDPVKSMVGSLISQCGAPERVIRARTIQLIVMFIGLFALGPRLGIAGVALAVDIMLVLGVFLLYAEARRFVDFSLKRFYAIPALALGMGIAAVYVALALPGVTSSDWLSSAVKVLVFSSVYVGILLLLEREQLFQIATVLLKPLWTQLRLGGAARDSSRVSEETVS
jgi:O-antigen/teichoic acid export membrane protein